MRVALATCKQLPAWEVDDQPLIDALDAFGITICTPAWTDDVDWHMFDATIIRTTWDYHLHIEQFLEWSSAVPRLYNNDSIVKWNTHKSYLQSLQERGIDIAPTFWIRRGQHVDIRNIMMKLGSDLGFIKPLVGASASNTMRFDETRLQEAQQFLDDRIHLEMMVQPYLQSVETEGELSAIFIGGEFSHGVRKIPVKGDYRVQDDFGASDVPYQFEHHEIAAMENVMKHVPLADVLLYARVDYLRGDDGTLLLNELELVEPSLFFRHSSVAAEKLASKILEICGESRT